VAQLQVELVAVEEKVWSGDADMVIARTADGELGILPGHAPLLGALADPGVVRIKTSGGETTFTVHGGFLSVTDAGVSILAETAESGIADSVNPASVNSEVVTPSQS
jgi:F-type H+-transporting ATPase subunit epsilon